MALPSLLGLFGTMAGMAMNVPFVLCTKKEMYADADRQPDPLPTLPKRLNATAGCNHWNQQEAAELWKKLPHQNY